MASNSMFDEPQSRHTESRTPKPSLLQLEELYEEAHGNLERLQGTDLPILKNDVEGLLTLSRDLKSATKIFAKQSRSLSTRYNEVASVNESQRIREQRIEFLKDTVEIVESINKLLSNIGEDEVSILNIDTSSMKSGYSLQSQLSNYDDSKAPNSMMSAANTITNPTQHMREDPTTASIIPHSKTMTSALRNTQISETYIPNPQPNYQATEEILPAPFSVSDITCPLFPQQQQPHTNNTFLIPTSSLVHNEQNVRFSHQPSGAIPKQISTTNFFNERPAFQSRSAFRSENSYHNPNIKTATHTSVPTPSPFPHHTHPDRPQTFYPSSPHNSSESLEVLSRHLLQQDILKSSIKPFDGCAYNFWPWIGKLESYINDLRLSPLQTLQLLETHCTGEPQRMITNHLASSGAITQQDIQEVWNDLIQRFGSTQRIAEQLREKLASFPPISGTDQGQQLQNLYDLSRIILYNLPKCPELEILNLSTGLQAIRIKLPVYIQNEWRKCGQHYEDSHNGMHPPFSVFSNFIKIQARQYLNKNYEIISNFPAKKQSTSTRILQTTSSVNPSVPTAEKNFEKEKNSNLSKLDNYCHFHKSNKHSLNDCYGFLKLRYPEKKTLVFESRLCFTCLGNHKAADCQSDIKCTICNKRHASAMHRANNSTREPDKETSSYNLLDQQNRESSVMCTKVCNSSGSKNCSKTLLVELTMDTVPNKVLKAYCIIDEQANTTLVDDKVVQYFGKDFPKQDYLIKFASQNLEMSHSGSIVTGLLVKGLYEKEVIPINEALSCPNISDTTSEVATPAIVRSHQQIAHYAERFPEFDNSAEVLLLLGRNCGRAMATQCLSTKEPYLHKSPLGYSLVGNVCHSSNITTHRAIRKTNIVPYEPAIIKYKFEPKTTNNNNLYDTFQRRMDDDLPGHSIEDKKFLSMVSAEVCTTQEGNIQLPLPLKTNALPDNHQAVYTRTKSTLIKLKNQDHKLNQCLKSMEKNIKAGYIEKVPSEQQRTLPGESWHLPIFPIEQTKKGKVRLVYDASARYNGVSLNDALYQGPDLNNRLRGVLLRFREKPVAFSADVENMFSNFKVPPHQKDYLRFFWYDDNNPSNSIVQYRSTSHIFGCTSSPAIANFAMKYSTSKFMSPEFSLARKYIYNSFYVDDGICSTDCSDAAINILSNAITILKHYNIRLHKIVSNSQEVRNHFPVSELANADCNNLPFDNSSIQHALGVAWETRSDKLVIKVDIPSKPFTKRGILSVVNTLYDPLGLVSPVILTGRLIQRNLLPPKKELTSETGNCGWDDPLPLHYADQWNKWKVSLKNLDSIEIPRSFCSLSFQPVQRELHCFSDASECAIGHVAYMRSIDKNGTVQVSFITGASKVSPRCATSMPRLELCAAVEASKCVVSLQIDLENKPDYIFLYSDSKVVLGYIRNSQRRFAKYVERRVDIILNNTSSENWSYINTSINPADIASRRQTPEELLSSRWFKGPSFLHEVNYCPSPCEHANLPILPEERTVEKVLTTSEIKRESVFSKAFENCNNLNKLINVVKLVLKFVRKIDNIRQHLGISLSPNSPSIDNSEAIKILVKETQRTHFGNIISILNRNMQIQESDKISDLSPFLDSSGIIRVGGRLKNANLPLSAKHPALLPTEHPFSNTIIKHYHDQCKHQGTHISHGYIINAGYHIYHGRQMIKKFIKACILCRKLRAPTMQQYMADLPLDRLQETPPFTNVGLDVFGHFFVHDGKKTRNNSATKKIWAVIFVCLPSRAVHLEPLVALDTSSFRNALSRFTALRGQCKLIRSDQGTNLVCARKQFEAVDISTLKEELNQRNIIWQLNTPHASHMAGSVERKIGSVRRVLRGALEQTGKRDLSRDEFSTLLAEASSIVNNTPMWAVPNNPNDPQPLTPAMLLTLKDYRDHLSKNEELTERDLFAYDQKRYKRVLYLAEQFWTRWRREYIHELSRRHKWKTHHPCVTPGDLVLLREKNLQRNCWPLARVKEVKPSSDGLVRSVTLNLPPLKGSSKLRTLTRAIVDLVLLEPDKSHPCLNPATAARMAGSVK